MRLAVGAFQLGSSVKNKPSISINHTNLDPQLLLVLPLRIGSHVLRYSSGAHRVGIHTLRDLLCGKESLGTSRGVMRTTTVALCQG